MVVQLGELLGGPGDQPHVDGVVAAQQVVPAARGVDDHAVPAGADLVGVAAGQRDELGQLQRRGRRQGEGGSGAEACGDTVVLQCGTERAGGSGSSARLTALVEVVRAPGSPDVSEYRAGLQHDQIEAHRGVPEPVPSQRKGRRRACPGIGPAASLPHDVGQLRDGRPHPLRVGAADHDLDHEPALVLDRVAADAEVLVGARELGERLGEVGLPALDDQAVGHRRRAAVEGGHQVLDHDLEDARHARHDVHVADAEAGGPGEPVADQRGPVGDAGHPQDAVGHRDAAPADERLDALAGVVADVDAHPERRGHAVGGDVVVGRADAAGGEDVVVGGAQLVDRGHDRGLPVADHPDLAQVDPDAGERGRQHLDVRLPGAAGEDLVTDDEECSGGVGHDHEPRPLGGPSRGTGAPRRGPCRGRSSTG